MKRLKEKMIMMRVVMIIVNMSAIDDENIEYCEGMVMRNVEKLREKVMMVRIESRVRKMMEIWSIMMRNDEKIERKDEKVERKEDDDESSDDSSENCE